jgi:hypothetical protein
MAAELRAELLAGYARIDVAAAAFGKSQRTVMRWIERWNLPTIRIGRVVYLNIQKAKPIMLGEAPALPPPRPRGRPPKPRSMQLPAPRVTRRPSNTVTEIVTANT